MTTSISWPPELLAELKQEWPNTTLVRRYILGAYESATGVKLSENEPSGSELKEFVSWLHQHGEDLEFLFLKRRSVLVPSFFPCLSTKVGTLAQFHCPICDSADHLFPVQIVPIRITPASKQSLSKTPKRRAAFERALKHRFAGNQREFSNGQPICLLIVFVVKKTGKAKDIDNMAKAIIDAVKHVLFGDDQLIEHLNILKIQTEEEEYVYLNIRKTKINEHMDVLSKYQHHSWAGAESLNLEDFLGPDTNP